MTDLFGVSEEKARALSQIFGISSVCNVLAAIKIAKFYGFNKHDVIITVCTDAIDRYCSVTEKLSSEHGRMNKSEAVSRIETIFHGQDVGWIQEGTREARARWHNLKYFTWVEQQGKTAAELDAQRDPGYWEAEQARVAEIDRLIKKARG
jgi:hypothetical protein